MVPTETMFLEFFITQCTFVPYLHIRFTVTSCNTVFFGYLFTLRTIYEKFLLNGTTTFLSIFCPFSRVSESKCTAHYDQTQKIMTMWWDKIVKVVSWSKVFEQKKNQSGLIRTGMCHKLNWIHDSTAFDVESHISVTNLWPLDCIFMIQRMWNVNAKGVKCEQKPFTATTGLHIHEPFVRFSIVHVLDVLSVPI